MWVRSLGREDALEEGMVTHSRILAWRIPTDRESGRLQCMGSQRVGHEQLSRAQYCNSKLLNVIFLQFTQKKKLKFLPLLA